MKFESQYTWELFETICRRYAAGETLLNICKALDIPRGSVWHWAQKDDVHLGLFKKAKEACATVVFEEGREILNKLQDYKKPDGLEAKEATAWVTAQRVAAEGKAKVAGILDPAQYGNKDTVTVNHNNLIYAVSFSPDGQDQVVSLSPKPVKALPKPQDERKDEDDS